MPDEHEQYRYYPPLRHDWNPDDQAQMETAAWAMNEDHAEQDFPTHEVRLRRGPETLQIRAFAGARVITFTHPRVKLADGSEYVGSVRHLPVGYLDMADFDAFYRCFLRQQDSYLDQGWELDTCSRS